MCCRPKKTKIKKEHRGLSWSYGRELQRAGGVLTSYWGCWGLYRGKELVRTTQPLARTEGEEFPGGLAVPGGMGSILGPRNFHMLWAWTKKGGGSRIQLEPNKQENLHLRPQDRISARRSRSADSHAGSVHLNTFRMQLPTAWP